MYIISKTAAPAAPVSILRNAPFTGLIDVHRCDLGSCFLWLKILSGLSHFESFDHLARHTCCLKFPKIKCNSVSCLHSLGEGMLAGLFCVDIISMQLFLNI